MQHIVNIRSNGQPSPIQILNNKVILTSNIHQYQEDFEGALISGYEYDCDIYNKDEYLLVIAEQANHIAQLEDELAATKILLGVDE